MVRIPARKYCATGLLIATFLCVGICIWLRRQWYFSQHRVPGAHPRDFATSCSNCPRRTFFFVETSGTDRLNARQACSVESAAVHHPNITVKLLMTARPNAASLYLRILRKIRNIRIGRIIPQAAFQNTSLESWYVSPSRLKSPFAVAHLSDALRLLLLWRHGGLYADTDVIVQRSMIDLRNVLGKQDHHSLGNGVLVFDKGHPLLLETMEAFSKTYNPMVWSGSGPLLLEEVLKGHCSDFLNKTGYERCGEVDALPTNAFYAVQYPFWNDLFIPQRTAEVLRRTNDSFLIHFWNMLSRNTPVFVGQGSTYDVSARKHCPSVYQAVKRIFVSF
ncbi:lactosylceramide 4-alpha-galactosyltransferase-like [Ornithodoros turicata]|uniref:lactosylceramide 4-alpha-galactosyltransferase-like n=1 Tax=Ornithodoros turicata TaxID=34597 RepID=UPI0031397DF5